MKLFLGPKLSIWSTGRRPLQPEVGRCGLDNPFTLMHFLTVFQSGGNETRVITWCASFLGDCKIGLRCLAPCPTAGGATTAAARQARAERLLQPGAGGESTTLTKAAK